MNKKMHAAVTDKYSSIMKMLADEYKDYNKPFALNHYINRQYVTYNYTHSASVREKIQAAGELFFIFTERRDIFFKGINNKENDWKIIEWKYMPIFIN